MQYFLCAESVNSGFGRHVHVSEEDQRDCILWLRAEAEASRGTRSWPVLAPYAAPVVPSAPVAFSPSRGIVAPATNGPAWRSDPSTSAQHNFVAKLGGDVEHAKRLTKGDCSDYIEQLKRGEGVIEDPNSFVKQKADEGLIKLLQTIKDGYYAVREDDASPVIFFKVSRPTGGNYKGAFKVMTQHSETWKLAYCLWSNGTETIVRPDIITLLLLVRANAEKAAAFYAFEKNRCQICGKELTDDRSRYYGIGPECEKTHQVVIEDIEYRHGPWEMGKLRQSFDW